MEITPEMMKEHKKTNSCFDIKIPTATLEDVRTHELFVLPLETDRITIVWCKFVYPDQRAAYEMLRDNFEKEICDLIVDKKRFNIDGQFYMLATHEMDPGFIPSRRWRWIGLLDVQEKRIEWCWIHPYFRDKSIMAGFLVNYATEIMPIFISPPATPKMQHALKKAEKVVSENAELSRKHTEIVRKHLQEEIKDHDFSAYSAENINLIFHSMQTLYIEDQFTKKPLEERRKIMGACVRGFDELVKRPDLVEEMKNAPEFIQMHKDQEEKKKRILNHGYK
jgi:hypothetical protein